MNTNPKLRNLQRHIKSSAEDMDSHGFFNLLTSPELNAVTEQLLPEHRERKYSPIQTLSMFISQALSADRSCQNIVNTVAVQRSVYGLPRSTHTGSYCKARQRLPLDLISELTRFTGKWVDEKLPKEWRWNGRAVRLIDGTTVTMPDTASNQLRYPQQNRQKPGLGFPICRVVGIICLGSGSIMNASIGLYKGKGASETSLLRSMLDTLKKGDVVVGDALYGDYFLLAELMSRGVDAVFDQLGARRKCVDFRKGKKLGSTDHLVTYKKPTIKPAWMTEEYYQEAPDNIQIREIKAGKKVLVSTMLSPKDVSKKSLKKLYKDRWHIELDFRNIKTTMGMCIFSCKSPDMVEKEMWVYFLAYNLIRLIMAQSALLGGVLPRQISFKHTVQIWLAYRQLNEIINNPQSLHTLCLLVIENTVGHRPGRIEPREVKRRPKPYKFMTVPRSEARAEVKKNGRPRNKK